MEVREGIKDVLGKGKKQIKKEEERMRMEKEEAVVGNSLFFLGF